MKKALTIILFSVLGLMLFAQSTSSAYYINYISSSNGDYYLQSIPFDNIGETNDGKTIVYNADSVAIYEIPRYFNIRRNWAELYLSNDGNTVVFIINNEFTWKGNTNAAITFFTKDGAAEQVWLDSIITCDPELEDCHLFYKDAILIDEFKRGKRTLEYLPDATDFEKSLCKRATYNKDDSIIVFCKTGLITTIDVNKRSLSTSQLKDFDSLSIAQLDTFKYTYTAHDAPLYYGFPKTKNGESVTEALARFTGMKPYDEDKKNHRKLMKHTINVTAMFNNDGSCEVIAIRNFDSIPQSLVDSFFKTQLFDTDFVPELADKWRCSAYISLRNKNKKVAKAEKRREWLRQQEYQKELATADSIGDNYVPKNLEECFLELNKLLKQKDIIAIKNLKDRNETIMYHHGFGTWLRNNWGLWAGSRLSIYLANKGLFHPDDMSATILRFYYDWLNENHDAWREFEAE